MPIDDDDEQRRVAHSEARAHAREIDRQNSIAAIVSTKDTRKAVWDLLSRFGVFNASFDRDPGKMAFNEGRRDCGIWLLAQLEGEYPGAFALMRSEHQEREDRYEAIPEPRMEDDDE